MEGFVVVLEKDGIKGVEDVIPEITSFGNVHESHEMGLLEVRKERDQ